MNWSAVRIVFRKELREFFRDRRALFAGVILPILLYPVLTLFMTVMVGHQVEQLSEERYSIGVSPANRLNDVTAWYNEKCAAEMKAFGIINHHSTTDPAPAAPRDHLPKPGVPTDEDDDPAGDFSNYKPISRSFNLDFIAVDAAHPAEAIQQKKVKAVIVFKPAANPKDEPDIDVLKESADMRSLMAANHVASLLAYHRDQVVREQLRLLGVNPDKILKPFDINTSADISSSAEKGGALFGGIVPFMIVMMLIGAASYPAIDVTTGERERGTMETLLIAPVRPYDLVTGKFLAVLSMALLACFFNVLSLGVSMYFGGAGIMQQLDLSIPWMSLPWLLLLLLPLAILFSALLMLAGSFAASTKEAQTYLTPVIMLAMFPSLLAMVPGIELSGGWLFLPIGNVALLSRDLLSGQVHFPQGLWKIAFVLGSTWLYASAVVGAAGALFGREEVLYGEKPWRVLLDRHRLKPRSTPSAWEALLITASVLPIFIYATMALDTFLGQSNFLWANFYAQVAAMAFVPWLYAWRSRSAIRDTLGLLPPRPISLAGIPFVFLGGYLLANLVAILTSLVIPPDQLDSMQEQIMHDTMRHSSMFVMLLLIAVTPAVCEELLFRGFLLQSLKKNLGMRWAILIQAAAFAFFHQSVSKLPYTFMLGLILGVVAWRAASIFPGMLIHFLVNAVAVWMEFPQGKAYGEWLDQMMHLPHLIYLCAAMVLFLAFGFLPMFVIDRRKLET